MKNFFLTGVALMLLFNACSKKKVPGGILEPEKMQEVYWDFIRADVFANEIIIKDSGKNIQLENAKMQQQLFKNHGVTKEGFYKSYEYYLNHPVLMKQMIDTMLVRQEKIAENLKQPVLPAKKIDSFPTKMDSAKMDSTRMHLNRFYVPGKAKPAIIPTN
jgi:hypothetical protein